MITTSADPQSVAPSQGSDRFCETSALILVLGVHRSGTSLLTRGVVAAGARAGNFPDKHDLDNPEGYLEHPEILKFNDRLLDHLGVSWDNWGFRASDVDMGGPDLANWREEAASTLRTVFVGTGPFVLKDPRLASLAPFWERVVPQAGFALRRILILRDPAEVAESQRQRVERRPHEFPVIADVEPMAALWAVTMSEVLAALTDDSTLLVDHASLLKDPLPTLAAAATFAGLSPEPEVLARFSADGIKQALYRARASTAGHSDGAWMSAARALFGDLTRGGTPRVLSMLEARAICHGQRELISLMRALSAVRPSISRMQNVQQDRQQQYAALGNLVWAIAPLAAKASAPALAKAIEQTRQLAEASNLPRSSFAFSHTVGRLLLFAGRKGEALAWLDRIRPQFGHTPAYRQLEQQVSELPDDPAG